MPQEPGVPPSPNSSSSRRSSTVNWRGRQQRRKAFGIVKFFAFVVFLGVVVGLGIVFKGKIMKMLEPEKVAKPKPPKQRVERPAPKVEAPPPAPKPEPKKVEPPPPPPEPKQVEKVRAFDEAEEQQAKQLIEQGREAMARLTEDKLHFDFKAGKSKFEEAARLKASKETHDKAKAWVKKVGEFKLATGHIKISEFGTAETSYVLDLANGQRMSGVKVKEDKERFHICAIPESNPATLGKSTFPIPKTEIAKTTPVPLSKRQSDFRQFLLNVESGMNLGAGTTAQELYDLVFLAKRLGLAKECIEYLDRAYGKCTHGQLGNTYRKLVVDRAIERAALLAAANRKAQAEGVLRRLLRTLPGYQVAKDEVEAFRIQVIAKMKSNYRSTLALKKKRKPVATPTKKPVQTAKELAAQATDQGGGEEIVVDNSGVTGKGAAAGVVAQANKEYELGMKAYRLFRSGTGGQRNAALRKAANHLTKAVDLYGKALDMDPNNAAIENRQQEANMIRYGCMKYLTL